MNKTGMWMIGGIVLALGTAPQAARAAGLEEINPEVEYRTCLDMVRSKPKAALEYAGQWAGLGGGIPAEHCKASAMDALGEHHAAATLLEDLATQKRATAEIKASLLQQAAAAWSSAGQTERALGVLNAAITVNPQNSDLYEDRAVLLANDNKLWEAIDDLNTAIDNQPQRVSALALRAAAYRRLQVYDLAGADIQKATKIAPKDPDLWLEAGNLALATKHPNDARQNWMNVLRLAPDSASADAARDNIEKLDVKQ